MQPEQLHQRVPLVQGPDARVFQALDPENRPVLLKTIDLRQAGSWKELELFEREAMLLQQLQHPRLPHLLAWGREAQSFWLISEWIPGESLAGLLAQGWRPDEHEVRQLALQLLETLSWLHARQLVHRDLKPANLILNPAGELFVIDFGSVLLRLNPAGGSTVAGTFGYMAPEQLTGRAGPASDLYAAGATLIHLLSGQIPADLPQERLRLCFEGYVACSAAMTRWLQRMTAPVPEDRFASAQEALEALKHLDTLPAAGPCVVSLPAGDAALPVLSTAEGLEVILPPRPLPPERLQVYLWGRALRGSWPLLLMLLVFVEDNAFGQPVWVLALVMVALAGPALRDYRRYQRLSQSETRLQLHAEELVLSQIWGRRQQRQVLHRSELKAIRQEEPGWNLLEGGIRLQSRYAEPHELNFIRVGQTLDPEEQEWLCQLLLNWKNTSPKA